MKGGVEKSAFFKARLGVKLRIGSVNVGSMTGRSGEVADMAARRRLDFCCLQETKWKGGQSRWLGNEGARYKFYWMGVRLGVLWWLGLVSW